MLIETRKIILHNSVERNTIFCLWRKPMSALNLGTHRPIWSPRGLYRFVRALFGHFNLIRVNNIPTFRNDTSDSENVLLCVVCIFVTDKYNSVVILSGFVLKYKSNFN